MPCVIITGHPCCGKTSLAKKIRDRAIARFKIRDAIIINEETACPGKSMQQCYDSSLAEKKTRSALKSAFDREVAASPKDDSTLIILDSLNYIKGFRYELYCISKAAGKQHCVVWCLLHQQNNLERYNSELFEELKQRFEPPDERNRWDRPLYRVALSPTASAILDQSVYNMHNLAETIVDVQGRMTEHGDANTNGEPDDKKPRKKPSAFKRAKPNRSTGGTTATPAPKPEQQTLTAESLLSHDRGVDNEVAAKKSCPKTGCNNRLPVERSLAISASVEDQVDAMLYSFLNNARKLKEGASTMQHVRTDANLMHRITAVIADEKDPILRAQFLRWVAIHPPPDTTATAIRDSFVAFSNSINDKTP